MMSANELSQALSPIEAETADEQQVNESFRELRYHGLSD